MQQAGLAASRLLEEGGKSIKSSRGLTRWLTADISGRGVLAFLRRHPVVCLLLLSPGIPEYVSGSSPTNAVILNPGVFVFQLVANLGLYGPGVLLVREAMVRWRKGWASVLLLGAAYAILEEGIALSTLFNPGAGPAGNLGTYGHWLGVSWIWVAGILPVHMLFSISLPILLLALAAPATRGESLLSRRGLRVVVTILGLDVVFLFVLVSYLGRFWMGWPVFFSSIAAIALLVLAARRIKPDALHAATERPRRGPKAMAVVGALFYTSVIVAEGVGTGGGAPPAADLILVLAVESAFLAIVVRLIGSRGNERQLIALSLGLVLPIVLFGVVSEIRLPLSVLPNLAFFLFLRRLWAEYPSSPEQDNMGTRAAGQAEVL